MMRWHTSLALSILAIGCNKGGDSTPPGQVDDGFAIEMSGDPPRNLLVLSVDTTRRDMLAGFDDAADTPRLAALFDESFVFADHRSCSNWTFASVFCAQAGQVDVEQDFAASAEQIIPAPDDAVFISEILSDRGYDNRLITTNPFFHSQVNTADGFGRVIDKLGQPADVVNAAAFEVLDELAGGGGDWYLHVHYIDPHTLYVPPEEYLEGLDALDPLPYDLTTLEGHQSLSDEWDTLDAATQALAREHIEIRYRGELAHVDFQLGELIDYAESLGLLDDTMIIFWTDHGEALYDHDKIGHDYALFEEENRAVVSFKAPGLTPAWWTGRTTHTDLAPTALRLMDIEAPGRWSGSAVGRGDDAEPRFGTRFLDGGTVQFVELDGKKLTYRWTGEKTLFDLTTDPGETTDLYDPEDADVIALWDLLWPQVTRAATLVTAGQPIEPGP